MLAEDGDGQTELGSGADDLGGRALGDRRRDGRPRVVDLRLHTEPCRHQFDVVVTRQADGEPAVGGGEETGGTATARGSGPPEAGDGRPFREEPQRVDRDRPTQPIAAGGEVVGDEVELADEPLGRPERRAVGSAGEREASAGGPALDLVCSGHRRATLRSPTLRSTA